MEDKLEQFEKELTVLINRYSLDAHCGMFDYVIASHLMASFTTLLNVAHMIDTNDNT